MNTELQDRVRTFMENEARSCSMDFGCVDAKYVQEDTRACEVRDNISFMANRYSVLMSVYKNDDPDFLKVYLHVFNSQSMT